jgi:serine/threonine protein kinase
MTAAIIGGCMRLCYDPHSSYLSDHYRLGSHLGKGAFGEVRAARLRLKSHVYSKRAVGKEKDWEEKRAATAEPGSPDAKSGQIDGSLKSSGSKNNEQRRANQDKHHYIQGVMDWPYACKIIKKSRVDVKGILREIEVLDMCQHAHVLLLVEHFEDKKEICMIMGRCYGDVEVVHKAEKNGIPLDAVKKWTTQMLDGLAFVHSRKLVHRDIKLPNLMVTSQVLLDGDIVLGDFGFAEDEQQLLSMTNDICGTPLMLAPETFDGKPQQSPADVWAAGCCLYEMVTREHPFSNPRVQRKVKDGMEAPCEEMSMSVRIKRDKPGEINLMQAKLNEAQKKNYKGKEKQGFRNRKDFHQVATRFSTNARFVERFEELAVAVTSPAVQVDTSHARFQQMPELKDMVLKLLTRDVKQRLTAEQVIGKSYSAAAQPSNAAQSGE